MGAVGKQVWISLSRSKLQEWHVLFCSRVAILAHPRRGADHCRPSLRDYCLVVLSKETPTGVSCRKTLRDIRATIEQLDEMTLGQRVGPFVDLGAGRGID
jgi:hypothetical protein